LSEYYSNQRCAHMGVRLTAPEFRVDFDNIPFYICRLDHTWVRSQKHAIPPLPAIPPARAGPDAGALESSAAKFTKRTHTPFKPL
jgi:hypothetical protein